MTSKNTLTSSDIRKIATLANLIITADEEKIFAPQLSAILNFISKLQKLPTKSIEPTSQVTGLTNVFREDVVDVSRTLTQDEALSNAKRAHSGFFVVPAIFKE